MGSEMCIRDRVMTDNVSPSTRRPICRLDKNPSKIKLYLEGSFLLFKVVQASDETIYISSSVTNLEETFAIGNCDSRWEYGDRGSMRTLIESSHNSFLRVPLKTYSSSG